MLDQWVLRTPMRVSRSLSPSPQGRIVNSLRNFNPHSSPLLQTHQLQRRPPPLPPVYDANLADTTLANQLQRRQSPILPIYNGNPEAEGGPVSHEEITWSSKRNTLRDRRDFKLALLKASAGVGVALKYEDAGAGSGGVAVKYEDAGFEAEFLGHLERRIPDLQTAMGFEVGMENGRHGSRKTVAPASFTHDDGVLRQKKDLDRHLFYDTKSAERQFLDFHEPRSMPQSDRGDRDAVAEKEFRERNHPLGSNKELQGHQAQM